MVREQFWLSSFLVLSLSLSYVDSMLATCGCDQYVILWDMKNYELIGALRVSIERGGSPVHLNKPSSVGRYKYLASRCPPEQE